MAHTGDGGAWMFRYGFTMPVSMRLQWSHSQLRQQGSYQGAKRDTSIDATPVSRDSEIASFHGDSSDRLMMLHVVLGIFKKTN